VSCRKARARSFSYLFVVTCGLTFLPPPASAQPSLTWDEVKARFEAANPALRADAIGIDEAKAEEITAYLRPNPNATLLVDQLYPFYSDAFSGPKGTASHIGYRPFENALTTASLTYLHEREHKRELRLEDAKENTDITTSLHADLERSLIFNLREAFVSTLQAKRVLDLAKADLEYYDKIIDISRNRKRTGDIAQIDLDRIELLRVQYESELQTAIVNLRTAKIQLLQLLNDHIPVDQFDVTGVFDWNESLEPLDAFRQAALDNRPDLRAAALAVTRAKTDHQLAISNGSTDPTFSVDAGANPSLDPYVGVGVSIPLRMFDRNQGEKKRTLLDIDRSHKIEDAARAQVFADVDSAYEQVRSNVALLKPYKEEYRDQATRVRDTVTYAYMHGGASLIDFLNAQSDYRVVQLAYAQLIGSYLSAAGQLNMAVGREVIQ
jgi:cobalt-zinc-cadmium efflux system outer membrane protein